MTGQGFVRVDSQTDTAPSWLTRHARGAWPYLLVWALVAQSVLGRIDGALRTKHVVLAVPGGVGDIASPTVLLDTGKVDAVVSGWSDDVGALLITYLVFDVVLMALTTLLLLALRSAVTDLLEDVRQTEGAERASTFAHQFPAAALSALRWSSLAVFGYLFADLVETGTAVLIGLCGGPAAGLVWLLGSASLAKWLLLVLALVPVALAAFALTTLRRRMLAGLNAVRGLAVVALVLVVLFLMLRGDMGRQIDDVVGHAAQSWTRATLATLLALGTSWVMVLGGERCVAAYRRPPDAHPLTKRDLGWSLVVAALLVGAGAVAARLGGPYGPTAVALAVLPGAALLGWALLSLPAQVRDIEIVDRRPDPPAPPMTLVWVLASVPPVLLLLSVVRASVTVWAVDGTPHVGLWSWTVVLVLLVAGLLHRLRGLASRPGPSVDVPRAEGLWWTAGAALLLGVAALWPGAGAWMGLGTVGVVFLFALIVNIAVVGLTLLGDALASRGALAVTGLRRMPVLSLLVVWGVVASLADTDGRYYDVKLMDREARTSEATAPSHPDEALQAWLGDAPGGQGQDRSLVFVTASGGGIRAAYWTELVWACAFGLRCGDVDLREEDRTDQVFMASGVSGGAVGLSLVLGGTTTADERAELFDRDFLAPAVAAAVARDLPNSVLRLPFPGHDRAATLADAFASVDAGLRAPFSSYDRRPELALSGTSVEDGCRFTLSTLRQAQPRHRCGGAVSGIPVEGPGQAPVRDGHTYLCRGTGGARADIRLADAAFLSARFPYVSPAATLHPCHEGEETYVLDGGMFDNSGGSSVTNVLSTLVPELDRINAAPGDGCVIPRLLVIDNQFASSARAGAVARPLQSLGPAQTLLSFYGDRSDRELARAVGTVVREAQRAHRACHPDRPNLDPKDAVVVVHPVIAGGAAAPLGWTLAGTTREAMARQVQIDCERVDEPSGEGRTAPDASGMREHRKATCAALRTVDGWWDPQPQEVADRQSESGAMPDQR